MRKSLIILSVWAVSVLAGLTAQANIGGIGSGGTPIHILANCWGKGGDQDVTVMVTAYTDGSAFLAHATGPFGQVGGLTLTQKINPDNVTFEGDRFVLVIHMDMPVNPEGTRPATLEYQPGNAVFAAELNCRNF